MRAGTVGLVCVDAGDGLFVGAELTVSG
jgi:hypothetical protein